MDWITIVTVFVTSILAPWLAKAGLNLDSTQTAWLSTTAVTVLGTIVHFIETKAKMTTAATATKSPAPTTAQVISGKTS
jgi:uncharacterized membrane protein (DUF441 family)